MKKKTKILLMSILVEKNAIITEEIGICSIAAYLEKDGFDVELVNSTRTYLDYESIYKAKPDIIGVPMYSTTEKVVVEVCTKLKEHLPNTMFTLGGYWPTLYGAELLEKYSVFDNVICGEGEIAFCNLANAIEKKQDISTVKSLIYRVKDNIIENPREDLIENLDDLPFPRRDLLINNKLKYAYISTSRGCLGNCSFCWHQNFWGTNAKNRWRGRSPKNIVEEIKEIVSKYNVTRFWFIDDSFEDHGPKNPNRIWDIAQEIVDAGLNITYETYFRAEIYRKLDDAKIELLKKSGLVGLIFGIESGNDDDLRLYRKIATAEDNLNAVEYFRKHDIAVDIGFINFNPYSTYENLRANIAYLERTYFASVLYYIVERCGITEFSPIYYKLKRDGLLIEDKEKKCYSYHYINKDIGELSNYLYYKYHENEESETYLYAKKIGNIIREEFKLINYIKRNFIEDYPEIGKIIKDNEDNAWEILKEVNKNNASCFNKLLDTNENNGWDYDTAEAITEDYWNLSYYKMMSDRLENNRLSLYMQLNNIGLSPEEYFNFKI